jgi:hypothetical protein
VFYADSQQHHLAHGFLIGSWDSLVQVGPHSSGNFCGQSVPQVANATHHAFNFTTVNHWKSFLTLYSDTGDPLIKIFEHIYKALGDTVRSTQLNKISILKSFKIYLWLFWWYTTAILALSREDHKFEANLGYMVRPCLKKNTHLLLLQ